LILALGGRPAAAFANRLMVPVSNATLLQVVRRRIADRNDELTVISIDDFAFRRGQTYGTIVCDPALWTAGLPWLNDRWEEGTRNALALWRETSAQAKLCLMRFSLSPTSKTTWT
jgi:hypothetical protein